MHSSGTPCTRWEARSQRSGRVSAGRGRNPAASGRTPPPQRLRSPPPDDSGPDAAADPPHSPPCPLLRGCTARGPHARVGRRDPSVGGALAPAGKKILKQAAAPPPPTPPNPPPPMIRPRMPQQPPHPPRHARLRVVRPEDHAPD